MLQRFSIFLILTLVYFFVGSCGGRSMAEERQYLQEQQQITPSVLNKTITIDQSFTTKEQDLIVEAIEEWKKSTGRVFNPSVEIGSVHDSQPNAIVSVTKNHPFIVEEDTKSNEERKKKAWLIGMHSGSTKTIYIVVDRLEDKHENLFFAVVLHELGHYLGLDHSLNPEDVMFKSDIKNACISYENLAFFCSEWICNEDEVKPTCVD